MTENKMSAKERAQMMKELKAKHAETAGRAQEYLKSQQAIRRELKKVMKPGPMTIPQIAEAAGKPKDLVLWHVVAMKKYDDVIETGQDGDYYLYALAGWKEE
jgi:hypothetical protein